MKNLTETEKQLISIDLGIYAKKCGIIYLDHDIIAELPKIKELTDKLRDELIVMFSKFE